MNSEKTLKKFLQCWKDQNWIEMLKYVQQTWKSEKTKPMSTLIDYFSHKNIIKIKILDIENINNVMTDINFSIKYALVNKAEPNRTFNEKISARLICEKEPYKPDVKGQWGVNPVSILRGIRNEKING